MELSWLVVLRDQENKIGFPKISLARISSFWRGAPKSNQSSDPLGTDCMLKVKHRSGSAGVSEFCGVHCEGHLGGHQQKGTVHFEDKVERKVNSRECPRESKRGGLGVLPLPGVLWLWWAAYFVSLNVLTCEIGQQELSCEILWGWQADGLALGLHQLVLPSDHRQASPCITSAVWGVSAGPQRRWFTLKRLHEDCVDDGRRRKVGWDHVGVEWWEGRGWDGIRAAGNFWALLGHRAVGTGQEQPFLRAQRALSGEDLMPLGIVV